MKQHPRLLFLLPHLGGGGAEHVLALVASLLAAQRYEVHLATLTAPSGGAVELPDSVMLHALATGRVRHSAGAVVRLVRQLRPDLIVCGMYHLNLLTLFLRPLFPSETHMAVRQNGSVASTLTASRFPALLRFFYRTLYPRADRILCQSEAMAAELVEAVPRARERLMVLPSPLDDAAVRAAASAGVSAWTGDGPNLLAMGRLSPEKGFDLLLEAFVQLRANWPEATLTLAGEGAARPAIEAQIRLLGLGKKVRLTGATSHPWALFAEATLFVLPSRADALPNALLEAAAAGLPIVATQASRGLTALLAGQPGVWMAETNSAKALDGAMQAALKTIEPGQRFAHAFLDPYRIANALPLWDAVFAGILNRENT
jgi:glycosyltransferase involved in cell wall biosynthesis